MEEFNGQRPLLPICIKNNVCTCFGDIFRKPPYYNPSDILQYTNFNLGELNVYLGELTKHLQKDQFLREQNYQNVPAIEVKRANDHFLETVRKFQLYVCQTANTKGPFFFTYYGQQVDCEHFLDLYETVGMTTDKSIQLFNKPTKKVDLRNLLDVFQIHQICLFVFQQYYNVFNHGRPLIRDLYQNSKVTGFHFKFT